MTQKPVLWLEQSWPQLEEILKKVDTVLLPIGSTEQHGYHLPTGVDIYIPCAIADSVSKLTGVPVLPSINFVPCAWHLGFPGAINVSANTVINQIVEICQSLEHMGVKHVIGINGHTGGCDSTLVVAADQVIAKTNVRFWVASVVDIAEKEIIGICDSPVLGHADEIETAKMMAIRPDLVNIDGVKANNKQPKSKFLSVNYRPSSARILYRMSSQDWGNVAPDGYIGDPSVATPEKGEKMIAAAAKGICEFIDELKDWKGSIEATK